MADTKISALTGATTPLDGTEVLPIVQSSTTKKVANNDLRPKQIQSNATSGVLQVAGPTAATTRVMTTPDANFTVARTDAAQTFSGTQTFSGDIVTNIEVYRGVNNSVIRMAGGTAAAGGTMYLYGESHATKPNYVEFNADTGGKINLVSKSGAFFYTVGVSGGNITFESGKGIDFSANTHASGMTSELLDWYEEGTWTPSLSFLSGSVTYTTQVGTYTRVGRLVTVEAYIDIATASTPSTFVLMGGLPFTPANMYGAASIVVNGMLTTVAGNWVAQPRAGDIRIWTFSAGSLLNPADNIQAGSEIWLTCSYEV